MPGNWQKLKLAHDLSRIHRRDLYALDFLPEHIAEFNVEENGKRMQLA
jgi:hypothetical protein